MKRLLLALALMALSGPALAQKGRMMGGQTGGRLQGSSEEIADMLARKGLFETGLSPVFPPGLSCPPISSPFGSPTRYDNSARSNEFGGRHNGMDISLEVGTPLLAVADGEVVHAGTGGQLVGNFIWLRLAPEATGLPLYVFARYQHLDRPASLKPGDKVRQGEAVGPSGNTGTTGGHYGAGGYYHLHINLLASPSPDFEIEGNMPRPKDFIFLDPMGLYAPKGLAEISNGLLREMKEAEKALPVSAATADGRIVANRSKTVWPVACAPK